MSCARSHRGDPATQTKKGHTTMTKKDFILIAKALHASKPSPKNVDAWTAWCNVVSEFASRLACGNPRFDFTKFHEACMEGV
jgi:hypothetical protein